MKSLRPLIALLLLGTFGCRELSTSPAEDPKSVSSPVEAGGNSLPVPERQEVRPPLESLPDTLFVRLADYSPNFSYDLRYATQDNFLQRKVYDCGECYVRVITARALIEANETLLKQGLHLHFFDCYRPRSVQYEMWEIMPDPHYVANPDKGSIHNRGGAVDITLAGMDNRPLDMGTPFDHFGEEAHHAYADLPEEVLENRRLLREVMEAHGFWTIRTEWWHFNLQAASHYPNADFRWPCPSMD